MSRYYASVQIEPGRWTPVTMAEGFPTYRHAAEAASEVLGELGIYGFGAGPAKRVKILLDVTSVDLTDRNEFLAFMAYDPVLRTMFEFARNGGGEPEPDRVQLEQLQAQTSTELALESLGVPVIHLKTDLSDKQTGGEQSATSLRKSLPVTTVNGYQNGGRNTDVRICKSCGCTDDDCSGCIAREGLPCHWVADDLCSACSP